MATQKPISTISYNSEEFLREKLEEWHHAHIIQAYQYIVHKGEDGDKDHIHLRIEPNKRLDPMDLQEDLKEYVRDNAKPLGCRPFRPSKEEDWFLYAVHEPSYLSLKYNGGDKGEKIPYSWQDIKAPDDYDVEVAFIRAMASLKHSSVNMATRLRQGDRALDLVLEGENPYMVNSLMRLVSKTDFERLSSDYRSLQSDYNTTIQEIQSLGYVVGDDGHVYKPNNDGVLLPVGIEEDDELTF